jgi:hypothetical protein
LKEVCQKVLEIRGAFSAIVVGLGFPTSLEDKIWAKIGEMAGGLLLIISIVDNVVSTRAWELFENLFKSPFSEDVTFMIASKAPAAPKVEVSSGVAIIQSGPYYIGETINARFRITNKGSETITLHVLTIGGRGPEGDVQDFTFKTNIVINPGEAYDYEGELTLLNTGSYHFFVAYQTVDGVWVTNVPASAGAVNSLDINVLSPNSWVAAELCSPGELRIYDSQDRVTCARATQNETHSFLYFTYTHSSTYEVTIQGTWAIPEFPSTTILLTIILNTLTAIILLRKKRKAKGCIKL